MGRYSVILADPPWRYNVFKPGAKTTHNNRPGLYPVAVSSYDTLPLDELKLLPIAGMSAKDCALFMWATMPCLPQALDLMASWGFAYKTVAFTWVKTNKNGTITRKGMGHYTMGTTEICLIGTKGTPKRINRNVAQVITAPRRQHSRKPDQQYGRIMRLFDGPYLELFARQQWPNWDVWGNQTNLFPAQPFLLDESA